MDLQSSLYRACSEGNKEVVLRLANPNSVGYVDPSLGDTPLHQACKQGWLDVVKLLIEQYNCDPNVMTKSNQSPLHYACRYGHIDVVKYLMSEQHINPLLGDYAQLEPLDYALDCGNINIAIYICQHISSNDMLKTDRIKTTVHLINSVDPSDPRWMTANGDNIIQLVGSSIHFLCALCQSNVEDTKIIELMQHYMLKDGLNPDMFLDSEGNTALHIACKANKLDLISYLINQAHCDPNIKNKRGSLPLDMTTNPEVIDYLCQHDHVAVYSRTIVEWMNKHRSKFNNDTTMLRILKSLVDNHRYKTEDGSTLLHVLCMHSFARARFVDFLLTEDCCDLNCLDSTGQVPLQVTSSPRIMSKLIEHGAKMAADVVFKLIMSSEKDSVIHEILTLSIRKQAILWNPNELNGDGYTALHLACKADNPSTVNILLSEAHCDPNCLDGNGKTPLQVTSSPRIMAKLIEHGAKMTTDVVFKLIMSSEKDSVIHEILTLSIRKQAMLWNPNELNGDGYTALHLACKADNPSSLRVNILLSEAHCDPNCLDGNGKTPLQVTSSPRIMAKLIEHGAKMTADVVFKLIMSSEKDSVIHEILTLSIKKQAMLWNPNELNGDGYTALHLACKADHPSTVNILLSEAHCDPNFKSKYEDVPLQMPTNPEIIKDLLRHGAKTGIMYKSHQKYLGTDKPVQPPVKVFIVGNPSVGKSTLTAALKKKTGVIARIFSGKVSGVDRKTVGIVPHDLENKILGRVTLYDFAGHREFYSGHAALLQTAIQSTPPVFLLVVNLCEQEDKIIKNILYWISFLENQCASVSCKPHIILVGSHADVLKGTKPKDKVKMITDSLNYCFINMEYVGFVAMNCQYHESAGMNDLRRLLIKSCNELRIQEPITFNAHCFLVFLINNFMNLAAVQIKTISEWIDNHPSEGGILEFLPKDVEMLYKICLELNDRGHILLLKDRIAIDNSYIVIDKQFLLSEVSGTVFAPEGFRQYKELSTNTGVVPLSKIIKCFPARDPNILIGFLTHLEFCHEVSDHFLRQSLSEQYSQVPGERYYFFPGLISVNADVTVWPAHVQSNYDHNFGWVLECNYLYQFFSSQFLQVLLLRLAFLFALETLDNNPSQSIGLHRNCYIWKNGIFWGNAIGMQTLVEVTSDNKSVVLLVRFQQANLLQCVRHQSEVIITILQCKEQFCPRVVVTESFIDSSSPLQYPLNLTNESNLCTLQDLATAVIRDYECPSIVLQSNIIPAKNFVSFEPYFEMKLSTIQELSDEKNENNIISETFLSHFAQYAQASQILTLFVQVLVGNVTTASSMKDDQIYQLLLKWRDSDIDNQKTYRDLRQLVDQYSVFVGRNIMKLAKQESLQSSQLNNPENERKEAPKLIVQGIRPKLHELHILELSDGRVLRIMESVAPQWKQMAIALGFSLPRIKSIEKDTHYMPEDASLEMFFCWLEGEYDLKPPTWEVLIQCLKQANLLYIGEMLSNAIKIEAEGAQSMTAGISETVVASSTPDVKVEATTKIDKETDVIHSMSHEASKDAMWKLRGVEEISETNVIVHSSQGQLVDWNGLKLHIHKDCLPEGVDQCTIYIKVSLAGEYKFPVNSCLVSAIFWLRCEPQCTFTKPITVEIQHCSTIESLSRLKIVRAFCSQKQLPYKFRPLGGRFSANNSYGIIEVNHFSGYGVTQESPVLGRKYYSRPFYRHLDNHEIDITFVWNTEPHINYANKRYSEDGFTAGYHKVVELVGSFIEVALDAARRTKVMDGQWEIQPAQPRVTKEELNDFKMGQGIPACVLEARPLCDNFPQLLHQITLLGIKPPQHELILSYRPSRSDKGSSYIQTKPVYPTSRGGATFIHTSHPNYSIGSHSSQFIQHPHTYEPQGPRPVPFNGGLSHMPTQLMYFNPVQGASFNRITYPSSSLGNLHVSAPFILSTQSPCSHDPPTPSTSAQPIYPTSGELANIHHNMAPSFDSPSTPFYRFTQLPLDYGPPTAALVGNGRQVILSIAEKILPLLSLSSVQQRLAVALCAQDLTFLDERSHSSLLKQLQEHSVKWREIGLFLGFRPSELDEVQVRPLLVATAPRSWLSAMLALWLQWAPGDSRGSTSFATLEALKTALNQAGLGVTAHSLGV